MSTHDLLGGLHSAGGLPFKRLAFVPAQQADAHSAKPTLDLIPLNEETTLTPAEMPSAPHRQGHHSGPKEFCGESSVRLSWQTVRKAGAGLINLGNTCFMNSVLQCLTHTPPLAELCLAANDLSHNSSSGLDAIRITQAQIKRAFASGSAVRPVHHAKSLKAVNRRFRLGRQEDAHEYLRCLLDAMHEAYLKPLQPKPPPALAYTTFIYRIFGGRLRSQIVCEGIDYVSSTYEHYLDLSLEINRASTLQRALQHFTAPEVLDGQNRYRCPKNNKLVRAHKRITIHEAPNVLTIQLKRFEFGGRGSKISKRVEYGMELDLAPFMSETQRPGAQLYDLFAVLVHHGHSLHSGHYVCYVKAPNGIWHLCDDHRVAQVSQRTVEGQQAYILFYIRRQPRASAAAERTPPAVPRPLGAAATSNDSKSKVASAHVSGAQAAAAAGAGAKQRRAESVNGTGAAAQLADRARSSEGAGPSGKSHTAQGSIASAGPVIASHVITSSTESTANATASASPKDPQTAIGDTYALPDHDGMEHAHASRQHLHHLHHHHHTHFLRVRPQLGLSSWDRHHKLFASLCRTKMRRLGSVSASDRSNGGAAGAGGRGEVVNSPAAAAGAAGPEGRPAKRARLQEQQQAQAVSGDGAAASAVERPRKRKQRDQGPQQPEQQEAPAAAPQQQAQGAAVASEQASQPVEHVHKHKRRKHRPSEQQASQLPMHQEHPLQQQPQQPPPQQQQQDFEAPPKPQMPGKLSKHAQAEAVQLDEPAAAVAPRAGKKHPHAPAAQQHTAAQHNSDAGAGPSVTGAAALQLLAQQAGPSQYGVRLGAWDDVDAGMSAAAAKLQRAQAPKPKKRDEWDEEYDRGKVKKVRKHKEQLSQRDEEGGNVFERAWRQELPAKARAEATKQGRGFGHKGQHRRGGPPGRSGGGRHGGGFGGGRGGARGRGGFGGGRGGGRGRGRGGRPGRGRH